MSNALPFINPETIFAPDPESPIVPWTLRDTWIGFALFFLVYAGTGILAAVLVEWEWVMPVYLLVYQPLQFIPILLFLLYRRAAPADLGLRKARPNVMAIGCGLLVILLGINVINNLIMMALDVDVQAMQFSDLLASLDQPAILLVTGILFAPLVEESIFRGFLFGGLRHKWGWMKAALVSSAIFGAIHMSIAAFIPTFCLGFLFAYLYQKSNSIWPGIILHTLINSVSLCALLTLVQSGVPMGF